MSFWPHDSPPAAAAAGQGARTAVPAHRPAFQPPNAGRASDSVPPRRDGGLGHRQSQGTEQALSRAAAAVAGSVLPSRLPACLPCLPSLGQESGAPLAFPAMMKATARGGAEDQWEAEGRGLAGGNQSEGEGARGSKINTLYGHIIGNEEEEMESGQERAAVFACARNGTTTLNPQLTIDCVIRPFSATRRRKNGRGRVPYHTSI